MCDVCRAVCDVYMCMMYVMCVVQCDVCSDVCSAVYDVYMCMMYVVQCVIYVVQCVMYTCV